MPRKRVFNRHKLKRKLKRAANVALGSNTPARKRGDDFAFRRKRSRNPFHCADPKICRRRKIYLALLAACFGATMYLALYNPFFQIKNIEVSGLNRINQEEFNSAIQGIIDYRKLLICPGKSYFAVNVQEIADIAKEKFPISSIVVKKHFPNTLVISVEEKISTVIYDNSKQYAHLDLEGNVVEKIRNVYDNEWREDIEITTTTLADGTIKENKRVAARYHIPDMNTIRAEVGDYPLIYDKTHKTINEGDHALDAVLISNAITWFNKIERQTDIPFGYITLDNTRGDAIIKTGEGWGIKLSLKKDVHEQFETLQFLLKEKIQRPRLNYIDLRYGEQVYWK